MSENNTNTLFVTNFPHSIDEETLKAIFEDYGRVKRATILTDANSGRSKGMGFVEFEQLSSGANGINVSRNTLDDIIDKTDEQLEINGRKLCVIKATELERNNNRSNNGNQRNLNSTSTSRSRTLRGLSGKRKNRLFFSPLTFRKSAKTPCQKGPVGAR